MNEFFFIHFCSARLPVNVRIACASTLPLDPQGVGLTDGDVAPEDLFNPILYKACSNFGMSQIEARINAMSQNPGVNADVDGQSVVVDVDTLSSATDEFPIYYGFLSNAHEWRHANPQSGVEMKGLRPLVYEVLYNVGDQSQAGNDSTSQVGTTPGYPTLLGGVAGVPLGSIRGNAKPLPFINTTSYTGGTVVGGSAARPGFTSDILPGNNEQDVPWINCVVGAIIVPPSRLHELFYRMVVEWTIEFSQIRPLAEITDFAGLGKIADITHYQNYSFEATKQALGVESEVMDHSQNMVDANVDINKVM